MEYLQYTEDLTDEFIYLDGLDGEAQCWNPSFKACCTNQASLHILKSQAHKK